MELKLMSFGELDEISYRIVDKFYIESDKLEQNIKHCDIKHKILLDKFKDTKEPDEDKRNHIKLLTETDEECNIKAYYIKFKEEFLTFFTNLIQNELKKLTWNSLTKKFNPFTLDDENKNCIIQEIMEFIEEIHEQIDTCVNIILSWEPYLLGVSKYIKKMEKEKNTKEYKDNELQEIESNIGDLNYEFLDTTFNLKECHEKHTLSLTQSTKETEKEKTQHVNNLTSAKHTFLGLESQFKKYSNTIINKNLEGLKWNLDKKEFELNLTKDKKNNKVIINILHHITCINVHIAIYNNYPTDYKLKLQSQIKELKLLKKTQAK